MKILHKLLIMLFVVVAAQGCNSSEEIEKPDPPKIVFDSDTGIYRLKLGRSLTLAPAVSNIADAGTVAYQWTVDGEPAGTGTTYTMQGVETGKFYIKLKVTTKYGEDEEEVRVDVSELALPVISFALAGGGFDALAGADYLLEPVVQNGDGAVFAWTLDGAPAGSGKSYTFNRTTPGNYALTLKATNDDGSDEKTVTVRVVDELPLTVFFEKPYHGAATADIPVFLGRTVYLSPVVGGGAELSYAWMVDGAPAGNGRMLGFTAAESREYLVSVTVTSGGATAERLSPAVTRTSGVSATASVTVACHGEESSRYRPAAGGSSTECDRVLAYVPAPGQFINDAKEAGFGGETTQTAANAYALARLKAGKYVSLGGFGGYIVVGFDHSVENCGGYEGYDFAIAGNQSDGSSEPGIVWVMQDVNGNGLPDDVWYELKGSETGKAETVQDYAVTYVRPSGAGSATPWFDNRGATGSVKYLGAYHAQDYYYPAWVSEDNYTLRGTLLKARNREVDKQWRNEAYEWGYADNVGSDCPGGSFNSDAGPMNVYFKISNAIGRDGTPAGLQYIDFIKVQTGVNAESGWTGELSTEVFSFKDVNP